MIDTIVLRLHGANQQKKDLISTLQNNKLEISKYNEILKVHDLDSQYHESIKSQIKDLETVNYQINNKLVETTFLEVPEHFELYKTLLEYKGKTFTRTSHYHHEEQVSSIDNQDEFLSSATSKQVNNHYLQLERMRYTDGDYVKIMNMKIRGKFGIASSTPDVTFSINPDGGFIDFNLSIPKYLYMHNLAQYVPQIDSRNYKVLDGNFYDWKVQRHYLHKRLMKFIQIFLDDLFTFFGITDKKGRHYQPNYDYVEIRRIDLCFNQIFKTKHDALTYLEHQKKIHKKSKLRYKQIDADHETSIAYHTSKHEYFKIYHKGSEYKSVKYGDFTKHHKINKLAIRHFIRIKQKQILENHHENLKNKQYLIDTFNKNENIIFKKFENDVKDIPFNVNQQFKSDLSDVINKDLRQQLQDTFNFVYNNQPIDTKFIKQEADKILRYEMSISGYSLNHLYKKYIFRVNDKTHQHYKKIYNKVKRVDARKNGYKYKITPQDRRDYYMMHDFYNRTSNFTLTNDIKIRNHSKRVGADYSKSLDSYSIQKSYWFYGKKTVLQNHDVFYFSDIFLKKLVDKFKKQIDYYQLESIKPYDDLINKVKKYNELAEIKLKAYNKLNDFRCYDLKKNRIMHKNRLVTKASQLLTESEKRKKGMQKINISNISIIFKLMHEDKMSFSQIRKHLNMSKHVFSRRKLTLESLGIYENSLNMDISFNVPIDFSSYYHKTKSLKYKDKFFFKPKFSTYG